MKDLSTSSLNHEPKFHRLLYSGFACIQVLLASGAFYGWPSIAGSILVAPRALGGAGLTLEQTTSIFATGIFVISFSSLPLGFILDRYGPRWCSIVSNGLIALGFAVFAYAEDYTRFSLGANLIAFGGMGVQNAVVHLGSLFPENQTLAMTMITSFYPLSQCLFPLFDFLQEQFGYSLRDLFMGFAVVMLISTLIGAWMWPDEQFEYIEEEHGAQTIAKDEEKQTLVNRRKSRRMSLADRGYSTKSFRRLSIVEAEQIHNKCVQFTSQYGSTAEGPNEDDEEEEDDIISNPNLLPKPPKLRRLTAIANQKVLMSAAEAAIFDDIENIHEVVKDEALGIENVRELSLVGQLTSLRFLKLLIFFAVTTFSQNFYMAAINTELGDDNIYSAKEQQYLARMFTIINSMGVLGKPIAGYLMDTAGFTATSIITLALGILQVVFLQFSGGSIVILMISFGFYSLCISFTYAYFFGYLFVQIGLKYFGFLNGVAFAVQGLLVLLVDNAVGWAQGTCHLSLLDDPEGEMCDTGKWEMTHSLQMFSFMLVAMIMLLEDFLEWKKGWMTWDVFIKKEQKRRATVVTFENM